MAEGKVADIIVERLIKKIEEEKRLPWQRPFVSACMNWYSKTEYRGINRLLLDGGEYITPNQLQNYNEKHFGAEDKFHFWFEKGTKYYIIVFYSKYDKKLTGGDKVEVLTKGIPAKLIGKIFFKDGEPYRRSWLLRYYRVYNIKNIHDKDGNTLEPRIGTSIIETYTPAEEIVQKYCAGSGVQIQDDGGSKCYYQETGFLGPDDCVHTPIKSYFVSTETYYRTLFHELVHSTGTTQRFNRDCFKKYSQNKGERSREELIAEVGSLLLASEAGFKEDTEWVTNSDNYIVGWIRWMADNVNEVVNGMLAAEKAKQYILDGGVMPNKSKEDANEEELNSTHID